MDLTEEEIRRKIGELTAQLDELEQLLQLQIDNTDTTSESYIFTLHDDSLVCEKYKFTEMGQKEEYYLVIDRDTLNKLVSWLVKLKAVKVDC